MDDRSRVVLSMVIGAGLGAVAGYLYLTESGRKVRDEIEPRIDDVIGEIRRWRRTIDKARDASGEAWRSLAGAGTPAGRPAAWESARSG